MTPFTPADRERRPSWHGIESRAPAPVLVLRPVAERGSRLWLSRKSRRATSVSRRNVQTRTEQGLKRRFSESHHREAILMLRPIELPTGTRSNAGSNQRRAPEPRREPEPRPGVPPARRRSAGRGSEQPEQAVRSKEPEPSQDACRRRRKTDLPLHLVDDRGHAGDRNAEVQPGQDDPDCEQR